MDYKDLKEPWRTFTEKILKEFPEWEKFIEIKDEDERNKNKYLRILVPCPSDQEESLYISSYEDQMTIAVGYYHKHFGMYDHVTEEEMNKAIELIKKIINEEIIIIIGYIDDKWSFSWDEESWKFDHKEIPHEYDTLYIKSWNGTYTKELDKNTL